MINGILLVDKPAGISSYDVIRQIKVEVRNYLASSDIESMVDTLWKERFYPIDGASVIDKNSNKLKIGHGGTLDPFATGMLLILFGKATKKFDELLKCRKTYLTTAIFGFETDTLDITGKEVARSSDCNINIEDINFAIRQKFLGEIMQTPPNYSAKKIQGRRACDIMRAGGSVKLEARKINIYRFDIVSQHLQKDDLMIKADFEIECSSGTYIRSLIADLGRELGCYATCESLRRTAIGQFTLGKKIKI